MSKLTVLVLDLSPSSRLASEVDHSLLFDPLAHPGYTRPNSVGKCFVSSQLTSA